MDDLTITGIAITNDGVDVGYIRVPRDIRKNGLLWQHTIQIPRGSDYDDEIEAVEAALEALLRDVLEDEGTAECVDVADLSDLEIDLDDDGEEG